MPRAAVIGSGPSGFYAAQSLLRRFPRVKVDILEHLPVPFGLVRYGVAPDHPATKNAISGFTQFMETYRDRVRFLGNLPTLKHPDLSLERLDELYNVTVNATGAFQPRGLSGIVPQPGVFSAHDFILWINGHPHTHACEEVVSDDNSISMVNQLKNAEHVMVLGQGNVSIDVARILLRPIDDLRCTDISPSALDVLAQSNIKSVSIVGRRAPHHASWTTAALREVLTKIPGITTTCNHELIAGDLSVLPRVKARALKLLKENTHHVAAVPRFENEKLLRLEFLMEINSIAGSEKSNIHDFVVNEVVLGDSDAVRPTAENRELASDITFLSLGYVGGSGEGTRVGWANGKARGIIGDNNLDAHTVVSGLPESLGNADEPKDSIDDFIREKNWEAVHWEGWKRIDSEEKRRGVELGRAPYSVKLESIAEMLETAHMQ